MNAAPHPTCRFGDFSALVFLDSEPGLRLIKGFHDEALAGPWRGYRSSRLGLQWRVLYRVASGACVFYVESVTPHDYRRP